MKKIKISKETAYILALLILSFSVNIMKLANFGMSMIVAPAYIISLKFNWLSYGQAEYLIQGLMFILFCILIGKFRVVYLSSFLTGVIYGTLADLWPVILPVFNTTIDSFVVRCILFVVGMTLTGLSIVLFFETYFYPEIYDFFVNVIHQKYNIPLQKFKICYDCTFLLVSLLLTFVLFGNMQGVGVGTVIMALINGVIIAKTQEFVRKHVDFTVRFKKLCAYLEQ